MKKIIFIILLILPLILKSQIYQIEISKGIFEIRANNENWKRGIIFFTDGNVKRGEISIINNSNLIKLKENNHIRTYSNKQVKWFEFDEGIYKQFYFKDITREFKQVSLLGGVIKFRLKTSVDLSKIYSPKINFVKNKSRKIRPLKLMLNGKIKIYEYNRIPKSLEEAKVSNKYESYTTYFLEKDNNIIELLDYKKDLYPLIKDNKETANLYNKLSPLNIHEQIKVIKFYNFQHEKTE